MDYFLESNSFPQSIKKSHDTVKINKIPLKTAHKININNFY